MTPRQRRRMELLLERFVEAMTAWAFSKRTIPTYTQHVAVFLDWLEKETDVGDLAEVTPEVLSSYQTALLGMERKRPGKRKAAEHGNVREAAPEAPAAAGGRLSTATQHARLSALRSFFGFLAREGKLLLDPAASLVLPKKRRSLPRALLTPKEALKLVESIDTKTPMGHRDRAVVEVLYATGIRNAELRGLTLADFDAEAGTLFVRAGKGGKDRVLPLGPVVTAIVSDYVAARPAEAREALRRDEPLRLQPRLAALAGLRRADRRPGGETGGDQDAGAASSPPPRLRDAHAPGRGRRAAHPEAPGALLALDDGDLHAGGDRGPEGRPQALPSAREWAAVKPPRLSPRDFEAVLSCYVAARRGEGLAEGTLVYRRLYLSHFLSWLKAEGVDDLRRVGPEETRRYAVALTRHRYRLGRGEATPERELSPRDREDAAPHRARPLPVADDARARPRRPDGVAEAAPAAATGCRGRCCRRKRWRRLLVAPSAATPIGLRDRAALSLLYSTGLRRSEVSALDLNDVDLTEGTRPREARQGRKAPARAARRERRGGPAAVPDAGKARDGRGAPDAEDLGALRRGRRPRPPQPGRASPARRREPARAPNVREGRPPAPGDGPRAAPCLRDAPAPGRRRRAARAAAPRSFLRRHDGDLHGRRREGPRRGPRAKPSPRRRAEDETTRPA